MISVTYCYGYPILLAQGLYIIILKLIWIFFIDLAIFKSQGK